MQFCGRGDRQLRYRSACAIASILLTPLAEGQDRPEGPPVRRTHRLIRLPAPPDRALEKSRLVLVRLGYHEYLLRWRPLGSAAGRR